MVSSLTNLVNNLSKGVHKIKYKYGHDDKICETYGTKYKYSNCFLEYKNFNRIHDLIEYKCLCYNKNYQQKFDEKLKEHFFIYTCFLTMIAIRLFHCWEKMFTFMIIWMIGKDSMKHHYLKNKIFIVT